MRDTATKRLGTRHAFIPGIALLVAAGCSQEVPVAGPPLPLGDPGVETRELPQMLAYDAQAAEASILGSPCDANDGPSRDGVIALTGGDTYEHEVHDCQRLVLPDPTLRFGPLAAVYPFDRALAYRSASSFKVWRQVAHIRLWPDENGEPGEYLPLGLSGPGNCLWLKYDAAWIAALDTEPCDPHQTTPRDPSDTSLRVVAHYHRTGGPQSYPRTARWGWDDNAGMHYIGLKCASGWCSIGPEDFTPREPEDLGSGDVQVTIPGWYDEQHLAVGPLDDLVPGPWGRISPTRDHYELRDKDALMDAALRDGFEAARIRIESHRQHLFGGYDEKFGLEVDDDGAAAANVFVRVMGTTGWADFRTAPNARKPANNRFVQNLHHAASGAVRWRWQETDETAWVSCKNGCCDIQPL